MLSGVEEANVTEEVLYLGTHFLIGNHPSPLWIRRSLLANKLYVSLN
jgi:hypothetical protein